MRSLVIGDIHGCFRSLRILERQMAFRDEDHVILLGDLVDRGTHSKHVIDWAIQRKKRGGKLTVLRGNHEWIMLWAKDDSTATKSWLTDFVGGTQTLLSYRTSRVRGVLTDIPQEHWDFLENDTHSWFEDSQFIYVHAHVDPALPMAEQPADQLFWSRFQTQPLHVSGKRIICGHSAQKDGTPNVKVHGVCIDTGCHSGGWLTCLDVSNMTGLQANEKGEMRKVQVDWPLGLAGSLGRVV
jgi:serine/threonine protein phosphatase 1